MFSRYFWFIILAELTVLSLTKAQNTCGGLGESHGVYFPALPILVQSGQTEVKDFTDDFEAIFLLENFLAEEKAKLFQSNVVENDSALSSGNMDVSRQSRRNCSRDVGTVILAVTNRLRWAIEMMDAWGKVGSGLLRKNIGFLGDFDQCMDVDTHGNGFDGRYCTTFIVITKIQNVTFSTTVPFYWGLCVPSSCDGMDVEALINEYIEAHPNISGKAWETDCRQRNPPFPGYAKFVLCICSMFGLILVAATVYEIRDKMRTGNSGSQNLSKRLADHSVKEDTSSETRQDFSEHKSILDSSNLKMYSGRDTVPEKKSSRSEIFGKLLTSFSLSTNMAKLFSTHQSQGSIGCIHGIKVISMCWVILFHLFFFGIPAMKNRQAYLNVIYDSLTLKFLSYAWPSVDTFFAISGLLLTYQVLKQLSKEDLRPQFFVSFYLHRFWRLTPPYMMIFVIYFTLYPSLGDGPLWQGNECLHKTCEKIWWANLLYINNFFDLSKQCIPWAWYLACDFQLYLVSPLMFLPMHFFGKRGLFVPLAFLLVNVICCVALSSAYNLDDTHIRSLDISVTSVPTNSRDLQKVYFTKPYTRMGPFVVGTVAGYLMFKFHGKIRLPKWLVASGWTASLVTLVFVVFRLHDEIPGDGMTDEVRALFSALDRIAWGASVCWIIFACANGCGGVIDTFLSWEGFLPLSRLTLIAYLIHPIAIFIAFFSMRTYFYMNTTQLVYVYVGIVILSYMASVILYLAFEAPMVRLEKVVKAQGRNK